MPAPGQPRGAVSFNDFGLGRIRLRLEELARTQITIGWQGDSGAAIHEKAEIPVAQLAAFHELGTDGMPARPALAVTFEGARAELNTATGKALSDLVDGRIDPRDVAKRIGELGVAKVRETIDDSPAWADPLAERTVKRKGHDHPLVETGELYDSVSWAERRDGKIQEQGGEA
jgi:hypothetical protein